MLMTVKLTDKSKDISVLQLTKSSSYYYHKVLVGAHFISFLPVARVTRMGKF